MAWLKYSLGGFGAVLMGFAALMVVGQLQAPSEYTVLDSGMAAGLVVLGVGLTALVKFAPTGFAGWRHGSANDGAERNPLELARPETVPLLAALPANDGQIFDTTVHLLPVLPTTPNGQDSSWIGGSPQLPRGTEWPVLAGKPAQFLAQIDCETLPDDLWGGLGPRRGALVFFRATQSDRDGLPVRVLHVQGPLADVISPDPKAAHARWPLQIAGADSDTSPNEPAAAPNWSRLHDVDLSDPAYQPFDWPSAEILLKQMKSLVTTCAERLGAEPCPQQREQLAEAALGLADLTEAFLEARSEIAFSDELKQLLIDGLAALTLPGQNDRAKDAVGLNLPFPQHRCVTAAYFAPFERYCRRSFASDPDSLPAAQRDLFEPLWAHNASHEAGCMGEGQFQACPNPETESMLLLELPSSELLGWTFGAVRSLRIYVCPKALAQGDLSGAWSNAAG